VPATANLNATFRSLATPPKEQVMTPPNNYPHDPERDLVLTRVVPVTRAQVWDAWTIPEHLKQWFVPTPWTVSECEIDLRPGGMFRTVMRSPDGTDYPNVGCFLEVVRHERLVFTDALAPGFRPAENPFFTAVISMRDVAGGSEYTAHAMHRCPDDREKHEKMGFHSGWSTCLDQLVAHMSGVAAR
jgi:uncharacterized protein YndB with AHSA1/START domain